MNHLFVSSVDQPIIVFCLSWSFKRRFYVISLDVLLMLYRLAFI